MTHQPALFLAIPIGTLCLCVKPPRGREGVAHHLLGQECLIVEHNCSVDGELWDYRAEFKGGRLWALWRYRYLIPIYPCTILTNRTHITHREPRAV